MPNASNRIANQLEAEGLSPDSQAYKERYSVLKNHQMEKIKAYGQLAAIGAANALGLDVLAAQSAALKAMENNTKTVFDSLLSQASEDPFTEAFERNLEEESLGDEDQELEQEQYADRRSSSSTSKSRSKGKEKALDENDYEDLEETDSFITDNIDAQTADKSNFQNLMWHIAEEEPRGRSRTREPRSSSSQGNSPPRDQKASFEKFRRMMSDTRDFLYEGQARFRNGERNVKTFLRAHGADWLDTLGYAAKAVDFVSGGTFSKAGELMGQASQSANTSIRRGLRDLTGNATFAQETADYIMLAAEMVTPGIAAKAMKAGGASRIASRSRLAALDLAGASRGTPLNAEIERFWTKKVEFKGNKVYQRDDLINPTLVGPDGRTNLQRMKMGHAPLTKDGKTINLHHMLQTQKGPIAEVSETFHQRYAEIIHINPASIPSGINRSQFDRWRVKYWSERAKDFEG